MRRKREKWKVESENNCEKAQAVKKLMSELEKGWQSGENEGWIPMENVRAHFHALLSSF